MERAAERGGFGDRIRVSVADYAVASGETLTTSGLGSCLGIALHDPGVCVGGLVHPMLPERGDETGRPPERFVDTGIELLIEELTARGANRGRIKARITGGAAVVDFGSDVGESIGKQNIAAAHVAFEKWGVELVDEEVGGECGRTMRVDTGTGRVVVERTDCKETVL